MNPFQLSAPVIPTISAGCLYYTPLLAMFAVREGSDGFDSRERSYDVGISPQEDRGGAASEVGEGEGGEEGGVRPMELAARMWQAFLYCSKQQVPVSRHLVGGRNSRQICSKTLTWVRKLL